MSQVTRPLRDEHKELLPHIEELRTAADMVGEASSNELLKAVDAAQSFLVHHLIPHATAEDRALYPVVDRIIGEGATATMSRDHVEVARLTDELSSLRSQIAGALTTARAKALRRVLYGLYTLVHVHFAKEEEIYLPLLDANLSGEEAHLMFERMEVAADEARAHAAVH